MKTRSAPTILLLMLSLFENTLCGIDPFDRLKFRLGDGYQVVAHGAIGRLDRLNLLIDTGSIPSMVDGRIAEKLHVEITEAESAVFDRKIPRTQHDSVRRPGRSDRRGYSACQCRRSVVSRRSARRCDHRPRRTHAQQLQH